MRSLLSERQEEAAFDTGDHEGLHSAKQDGDKWSDKLRLHYVCPVKVSCASWIKKVRFDTHAPI